MGRLRANGWAAAALVSVVMIGAGCVDTPVEVINPEAPAIQGLQKGSLAIGEVFAIKGRNFLPDEDGRNFLLIQGSFSSRTGFPEPVEVEVPVFMVEEGADGLQTVQWNRFGPFRHPFMIEGRPGTFEGTIQGVTERKGGQTLLGAKAAASFGVEPSIEFITVQPEGADCGIPALSGFGGLPYQIKVRAMGFTPTDFTFQITSLQSTADLRTPTTFRRAATGPEATLGFEEEIVFQDVPSDLKYYIAAIIVRATDAASGNQVEAMLPFDIHRPIELEYKGALQVAERYEPEPVTACIPGSIGNRATYSESTTQSVQRSVAVRLSQSWTDSRGVSQTQDWTEGYQTGETLATSSTLGSTDTRSEGSTLQRGQSHNESESNNFTFGTSDAENWSSSHTVGGSLSVMVGAEGGASIPLVAEGKVKSSTTATGSYAYDTGQGGSATASRSWGATSNRGSSNSMSESYTLNNSTSNSRSITDSTSRSNSRTYAFGGAATTDQRISQGQTEDEQNTWSESSSSTTLTSYSGFIPVGRFGVFYRQTIRMVRVAQIVSYNACGERELMGEMLLNEWKWAPDLAIGDSCDGALPPSNHPPAQCLIPPCD